MNHIKIECPVCHKLITSNNIQKHISSHKTHPEYQTHLLTINNKLFKEKHVAWNKGLVAWNKGLTKETCESIKKGSDTYKKHLAAGLIIPAQLGKPISKEVRKKISDSCLQHSREGTWHKSLAKNAHCNYKGIDFDSSWETAYAKYLDTNHILWERCKDRFLYKYQNKNHYYTPDFYLLNMQEYVEIKGYATGKDYAKWKQFPKKNKLIILRGKDLVEMNIIKNDTASANIGNVV